MSKIDRKQRIREWTIAGAVIVVIAIGAILAAIFARRAEQDVMSDVYIPKPSRITPEVQLLQQYIRFDTSNPPGNETPAAMWLAGLIRKAGVRAEVIESKAGRGSVYARIEGEEDGEGLLLLHHIDVVPAAAGQWKKPPFAAEVQLDQLYGRGAIDMKGIGIVFLRAFLDVAASGRRPKHDLVFLGVADEETGGHFGMQWLLANRPDIFKGVKYALNEGGITEMMGDRVTYYGIEIGTKATIVLSLTATERSTLQRARIALGPMITPSRVAGRVLPGVRQFFRDIAPRRIEFREELSDIDRAITEGKFWRLPTGYRELTQNIVVAEGVSKSPTGGFQMRTILVSLPDEEPRRLIDEVRAVVEPFGVQVEVVETEGPIPMSPSDTPLWRLLVSHAEKAFDTEAGTQVLNRFSNDSRFLRTIGIVSYGIAPFAVTFFEAEGIHGANESLRVERFIAGVEFFRAFLRDWADSDNKRHFPS